MKKDNKSRQGLDYLITIIFMTIVCVPIILLIFLLISGLLVIAYEDELYAKELNNPYVNSDFEGWHTHTTEQGSIILPKDWELAENNEIIQILHEGKIIAVGTLLDDIDSSFSDKEAFLEKILQTNVSKVNRENLYSLLGSSFGKLYINENNEFQGYYLNLANNNGSSLFFYFSSANHEEQELKSKAEAIIFAHKWR